ALETGARLILANMLRLPPYPCTVGLAREFATLPHEEDLDAVRATAQRAAELGIPTELLRVSSPRPVTALIELAQDQKAGLLVFGPDRSRISRRRYRSAAQAVRRDAPCLVWIAES
ncbi:MAG TPA: universal stress protein, partial [Solirubrobacteraceae bacterium]